MEHRKEKGRFAPTPSGRMHLGNVLCGLIAWLSARSVGGEMVLRIEDLDRERCSRAYADQMEEDLLWLGLDWDEGGSHGGPDEPYYQSQCDEIYEKTFAKLEEMGLLYPCFCSRAELHGVNAPHLSDGRTVYAGTCRHLTPAQREEKARRRPPAIRLMVPDEQITFIDGHYGPYTENLLHECGDFAVRRFDGVYCYQLAVVVDDARMGVTQVVRGSDLISSTPRQLYLYRLLGLQAPSFAHIPLLTAPDGRRLSKREKDLDMGVLRSKFTAPQLVGKLAFLSGLIDRPEPITARELLPIFDWNRIKKDDIEVPDDMFR